MQKKVWYYEKWVGRHASFPPRRSVKSILGRNSKQPATVGGHGRAAQIRSLSGDSGVHPTVGGVFSFIHKV